MTPADHYAEAEHLLHVLAHRRLHPQLVGRGGDAYTQVPSSQLAAEAQAHATLATAPAPEPEGDYRPEDR